jgi:hypothetical protein
MTIDKILRKIILYHYRRAGRDPDLREFIVVLEKDGKLVKVGEILNCEGTFHKPNQIFELIEKYGYKPVLVYSCFRWNWTAHRYVDAEYERYYRHFLNQDRYGRSYIEVLYSGYLEKVDVFKNGKSERFSSKLYIDHETFKETIEFNNIPKEVEEIIDKAEWLEGEESEQSR